MIDRIRIAVLAILITLVPLYPIAAGQTAQMVVYHLGEADNARWAMLLAHAHVVQNEKAQIVIAARGPRIEFLLEDAEDRRGNPYEPADMELMGRNVRFSICEATLKTRGITPNRVGESVARVLSGAYEIVRMQTDEGFAYVKL